MLSPKPKLLEINFLLLRKSRPRPSIKSAFLRHRKLGCLKRERTVQKLGTLSLSERLRKRLLSLKTPSERCSRNLRNS